MEPTIPTPIQDGIEIYRDARGEWRWRVRAANNRILADSAEGYVNLSDCLKGLDLTTRILATPGAMEAVRT